MGAVQIVLAKLVEDSEVVKPGQPDISKPSVLRMIHRPVAMVWLRAGTERDLESARKYAATEGYTVFAYPTSDRDPLARAKADLLSIGQQVSVNPMLKTAKPQIDESLVARCNAHAVETLRQVTDDHAPEGSDFAATAQVFEPERVRAAERQALDCRPREGRLRGVLRRESSAFNEREPLMPSKTHNPERSAWKGRSYKKGGERVRDLRDAEKAERGDVKSKFETWNVLAGAYLGRSPKLDHMRTHWVELDANGEPARVLCNRVKLENLCEPHAPTETSPICALCARKHARESA